MFIKKARCRQLRHWPDEKLVSAYCRSSQPQYLSELFARHVQRLFKNCHSYLKDREKSRDMVMAVFEKMLAELPAANFQNFDAWLFFLARNMCISRLRTEERRMKWHQSYLALNLKEEPTVDNEAEKRLDLLSETLTITHLRLALATLPARQRKCIELFFFERKTYREIAEETGFSLKDVKSYLQNAKRRLKRSLSSA